MRGVLAIVLGGVLVLLGAQSAAAHAQLLSTTPEDGAVLAHAPAEVILHFDEAVGIVDGGVRLLSDAGQLIIADAHVRDADVIVPLSELGAGRYALSYRVASADGHPVAGAISFTVGSATRPGAAAEAEAEASAETPGGTQLTLSVLTAIQYSGLLVFSGLVFFIRIVLRGQENVLGSARAVLVTSGGIAVAASLLLIPVSALNLIGGEVRQIVVPSAWWPGIFWPSVAGALLIIIGLMIVGTGIGGVRAASRRLDSAVAVIAAFVALCAPALVGHSQGLTPRTLAIAADIGHLGAGSFWVGGVAGLLLFLARAKAPEPCAAAAVDPVHALEIVLRFSRFAVGSVMLLAFSGVVMGVMIVGSVDALVTTGYGRTLLLKLAVVASVVVIAADNNRRLLPSLRKLPTDRSRWGALRRSLVWEAALLIVVLVITGFLTGQSPRSGSEGEAARRSNQAAAARLEGMAQQLAVDGVVEPGLTGDNRLAFTLRYQNQAVAPESVIVTASLPDLDLGPFQVAAEFDPSSGEYVAALNFLVSGEWRIQVLARVSAFVEPIVTIPITVR